MRPPCTHTHAHTHAQLTNSKTNPQLTYIKKIYIKTGYVNESFWAIKSIPNRQKFNESVIGTDPYYITIFVYISQQNIYKKNISDLKINACAIIKQFSIYVVLKKNVFLNKRYFIFSGMKYLHVLNGRNKKYWERTFFKFIRIPKSCISY